jgi:hypothetical protein
MLAASLATFAKCMEQGPHDPFNPSVHEDPASPDSSPSPDEVREEGQPEVEPVGPMMLPSETSGKQILIQMSIGKRNVPWQVFHV